MRSSMAIWTRLCCFPVNASMFTWVGTTCCAWIAIAPNSTASGAAPCQSASDNENLVKCTDCHAPKPHADARLNAHTDRLACQTCHIPYMAVDTGTKLSWDWSEAGQDLDITDEHRYLKIKGRFTWAKKVQPEYYWYNSDTRARYITGDLGLIPAGLRKLPHHWDTVMISPQKSGLSRCTAVNSLTTPSTTISLCPMCTVTKASGLHLIGRRRCSWAPQ